jgi:hypothetical protein
MGILEQKVLINIDRRDEFLHTLWSLRQSALAPAENTNWPLPITPDAFSALLMIWLWPAVVLIHSERNSEH